MAGDDIILLFLPLIRLKSYENICDFAHRKIIKDARKSSNTKKTAATLWFSKNTPPTSVRYLKEKPIVNARQSVNADVAIPEKYVNPDAKSKNNSLKSGAEAVIITVK